jgi:hypothetical protein
VKLEYIWAYVSEDDKGDEGLCGWLDERTKQYLPMIAPDKERLASLRPLAEIIAKQTNKKVKVLKFSVREDVEEIIWKGKSSSS